MPERYSVRVSKDYLVFCSGHFISYEGDKCERLHGHNYRAAIEIEGPLDENYYVFDFIMLKTRAKLITDREVEGQDVVDSARIVVEQAERMTALIRQLLDFARPRPLQKLPVNVTGLSRRVCELVLTIARKGNVTLVPPEDDDTLRAEADDGQLTQVVTNLVENGVRHGDGRVLVSLSPLDGAVSASEDPDTQTRHGVLIVVEDQGAGIPVELRRQVFTKFWRGGTRGGSGLGLYLVGGLVKAHGGTVTIDDAPGGGARIAVTWPSAASMEV